ncbi:GNAT family N-acetyltransferase [Sandarakinorhabdus oryzae]|uniref:GNAT family N-acetyltransferase n=1 Tax=Sandarakinorhabdus oryzae TaxID=2675220 RepID=UPI0012E2D868|nr:GNAT family N-acetyltransferase [Sandarakinorhabdus oryzae]
MTTPPLSYRDATAADAAVLAGIAAATFIETFGPLYKADDLDRFIAGYTPAAYAAELADPDIAVRFACIGEVVIGFCKVSSLKLPAPDPAIGAMELRQLYIYKPWQGRKIADALTDWAKDTARARGASEIWLSVFTDNPRARRFYARHGFEEVAPYHFMVGDQADEDILCRAKL